MNPHLRFALDVLYVLTLRLRPMRRRMQARFDRISVAYMREGRAV